MTQKGFSLAAGILFTVVAMIHLWRISSGWDVSVSGTAVPMSVSWAALIVTTIFAYYGLRFGTRQH